jgi:hypothetical protein
MALRNKDKFTSPSGRYEVNKYLSPETFEHVYSLHEWVVDVKNPYRLGPKLIAKDLSLGELQSLTHLLPADD